VGSNSELARAITDLTPEEWKDALHHLGQDGRRAVGGLLKMTVSGKTKEIGLIQLKAAGLSDLDE